MAEVSSGEIGTPPAPSSGESGPDRDAVDRVVVLGPETADGDLVDEFTGRGWQVWVAGISSDDLSTCIEEITDFLAAPESPDRAVLLGRGAAGAAAAEVADRHPERVIAVVVAGEPRGDDPAPGDDVADPPCPVLLLSTADPREVVSATDALLAGPDRRTGAPAPPPARLQALTPMRLNDPDAVGQLREMGSVHRINAASVAASWLVTGHEATTTLLADPRLVGEVEITAGFRLQSDDPALAHRGELDLITISRREHARLRRLVERHLTPVRVEALRPRIQREVDALLDTVPSHEVIDLLHAFAYPVPVVVLCELFGVPEKDRGYLYEWIVERLASPPPKAHGDIDDYLRALIAARRDRPSDDLLGWIVEAEGDRLSEEDLVSAARFLMVNGHRAPTTMLASSVAALLRRRDRWERLVADPALVPTAVEELLRIITPFPVSIARHVAAPIETGGERLPEGDLLVASLVAANRDPSFFTDPDMLDIGRKDNPHLAFGHGHHHCLGAELARAQLQIALGTLVRRFPDMELARDSGSLHYRQSSVRYLLGLPVVLEPDRLRSSPAGA
ncbi:cytochrome P450 [Microtetraspora sp. AC03309]|uniref:cytochrome P450 family protein n=1 Tax=Microtetraspora sp. AC03309 TaxID=2779376 RepID=UPI001E48B088|nr:cytochrome P450 [Microtetraspora sp. AC03309]MCC5578515.1 cytochrome P450 [Microtetraspora sp. AC03309]